MRVIGGEKSGQVFRHPGRGVRVTLDHVRESIFNILSNRCEGATVLDLFAGSGSLGIEALSRGASHVTFVEKDRGTGMMLKETVQQMDWGNRSRVWMAGIEGMLRGRSSRTSPLIDRFYDLVFMDPPYGEDWGERCSALVDRIAFGKNPTLVIELGSKDIFSHPAGWGVWKDKSFGQTRVRILSRESGSNGGMVAPRKGDASA